MVSVAFVARTTHDDPTVPGVRLVPDVMTHVPDTTSNVTAPDPDPPVAVNVVARPYGTDVVATTSVAWFALLMVMVVSTDAFGSYESSPARVARTSHSDPASPEVRELPVTVHVPAVFCHVTDPVPLPPVAVRANVWPYVAVVDVTVTVDCASFGIVA